MEVLQSVCCSTSRAAGGRPSATAAGLEVVQSKSSCRPRVQQQQAGRAVRICQAQQQQAWMSVSLLVVRLLLQCSTDRAAGPGRGQQQQAWKSVRPSRCSRGNAPAMEPCLGFAGHLSLEHLIIVSCRVSRVVVYCFSQMLLILVASALKN